MPVIIVKEKKVKITHKVTLSLSSSGAMHDGDIALIVESASVFNGHYLLKVDTLWIDLIAQKVFTIDPEFDVHILPKQTVLTLTLE